MKKHIPNSITCLNLFSGCIAVWLGFQGNYTGAMLAILISGVFDFLDGFAARALKAYSPLGKELDSLADVVSFGVAPGAVVFSLLSASGINEYVCFAAFLIPIFSALRLAIFNLDERQTSSFIGLPTPANAIFWSGLAFAFPKLLIANPWLLVALVVLFSLLLVANLPMFSLKVKGFSWRENSIQYIFLIGCIVLLIAFRLNAFAFIIAWYITFSIGLFLFKSKKPKGKNSKS